MASAAGAQGAPLGGAGVPQGAPQLASPRAHALMNQMSGPDWQGELEYPLVPGQSGFRVRTGPSPVACLLVWAEPQTVAESLAMGRRAWEFRAMLGSALSEDAGWGDPSAPGEPGPSDAAAGSAGADAGREEFARRYAFARVTCAALARAGMEPFCLPAPWHSGGATADPRSGEWMDDLRPGQGALLAARVLLRPPAPPQGGAEAGPTARQLAADPEALLAGEPDAAYVAWRAAVLERRADGQADGQGPAGAGERAPLESRARAEARRELALDALADALGLQPEMGDLADALRVPQGVSLARVTQALEEAGLMPLAFELALRQRARRAGIAARPPERSRP